MKTVVLAVEAIVLGGPSTAAMLYGLPVMVALGIGTLFQDPFVGAVGLISLAGCAFALVEFWRLAVKTIRSEKYQFRWRFWLGVFGAAVGYVGLYNTMPREAVGLLIAFPGLGAMHFSYLQFRIVQMENIARASS